MAKTVLTVDDSASIRQMVSFTLKSAGYEVVEAVDGMDGLEKAKGKSFNLVLTDQNMPRMDGLTLIKSVREQADYRDTPIIVLSTEGQEKDIQAGLSIGANMYMVKPAQPDKMVKNVLMLLGG